MGPLLLLPFLSGCGNSGLPIVGTYRGEDFKTKYRLVVSEDEHEISDLNSRIYILGRYKNSVGIDAAAEGEQVHVFEIRQEDLEVALAAIDSNHNKKITSAEIKEFWE
jgi:hypothetical protein